MNDPEYTFDPAAKRFLSNVVAATYTDSSGGNLYGAVDIPPVRPNHNSMTDLTRQEVDAKLAASEAKVDARLANFDTSIKTGFAELRAEMAEMRADMHKSTSDLIKWGIGLAVAIVGMTVGLLTYINKTSEKTAAAPVALQPAPIVITVPGAPIAAPAIPPKK